jgi:hypothetical protein
MKKTSKLFEVTLHLTPSRLAELVIDYSGEVHGMKLVDVENGAAHEAMTRSRTTRSAALEPKIAGSAVLQLVSKQPSFNGGTSRIAQQTAQKALSGRPNGIRRSELSALIAAELDKGGFNKTGAPSAITALIRGGALVVKP